MARTPQASNHIKKYHQALLAIVVSLAVLATGFYMLDAIRAATYTHSVEAETGTLTGNVGLTNEAAASGAKAVAFGRASTCAPSGVCAPSGNLPGWKQRYVTSFPGTVPVGAFSDCNHSADTPQAFCNGLRPYGAYFDDWWAYPSGWEDTAKSGADGNTGAPFGGVYRPESTISVSNGAMHIRMFRPSVGGDNAAATVVPRKCMDQQYGRYTERFKVVQADPGFKSAHLFYQGGFEIDYPENDYGGRISAYTHPGGGNFSTSAKWTDWHTTVIEWTPGVVKFYMDGQLIGTATNMIPAIKMSWILQNESSILGPYAAPGASAQLDIAWVSCYSLDV